MTAEAANPREVLTTPWNHVDVLMLAIAYLPPGVNNLNADSGEWNRTIADLKPRFPELFRKVHFSYRPPQPPHSDQLDDFFRIAGISGILETTSPAYAVFHLSEEAKDRIKQRYEGRLQDYHMSIREISTHIHQTLVVNNG